MSKEGGSFGDVRCARTPNPVSHWCAPFYCADPALTFLVGQEFEMAVLSQVSGFSDYPGPERVFLQVVELPVYEVRASTVKSREELRHVDVLCMAFFRDFSGEVLRLVSGHFDHSSRLEVWSGLRVNSDRVDHSDVVGEGDCRYVNGAGNPWEPGKRTEQSASICEGRRYVSEKTLEMKRSPIRLPMVGRT